MLSAGTKLGPYEIIAPVGAGGMGEVYRARDTKLNRDVALKILPDAFASDPDRLSRFTREAQTLASLNHPNIAHIHGLEESNGIRALVMELVEGEDLSARIARGAMPVDEALPIARQIAEALEAAHEQGIVHRDLKPANIKVRSDGTVKVLDFGLAKAMDPAGASSTNMNSPTLSMHATEAGIIIGTAAYMSPEQAAGKPVDKRSDLWAFGVVFFEMLTGRPVFAGETTSHVLAAVLRADPDWTALPSNTPAPIRRLLRRCLDKDRRRRLDSAAAARLEIDEALVPIGDANTVSVTMRMEARRAARGPLVAAGILGVVAIGVVIGGRYASTVAMPAALVRFEVQPPADVTLTPSPVASAAQLALSPDGRRLAFVAARRRGASQLWIRPLDGVEAQPLPGTEGASFPFWSPDSRFIAFFAGGRLKKIDTTGGVPQVLCKAAAGRGGAWNPDGIILFTGESNSAVSRISASGSVVSPATKFDPAQAVVTHYWPQFLPDGRHFLYYQRSFKPEYQGVYVTALDSSSSKRILENNGMALYASGHLVFVRDGTLFAQAFDDRALQTSGDPVRLGDHVGYWTAGLGYAAVTVSPAGLLAHGPTVGLTTSLRWHDRSGASTGPPTEPAQYTSPRLSPDQQSVVVAMTDVATTQPDLWVLGLARGTTSRLTSDPSADWFPVWSADGGRLLFGSSRFGGTAIFQKAVGGGQEEPAAEGVVSAANVTYPVDTSGDGRFLLYVQSTQRGYDLGVLTLAGERSTSSTFLGTPFNEVQGRFSPNTRWVAYASDESGRFEVYVRPFPAASGQTPISIAGGTQPEWRRDGKELFYISADGKLTAVPVTTDGATFSAGTSHALFDVEVPEANPPYPTNYAVTADGQRFFVNTVVDQPTRPALTVILNWTAALKK